MHRAGGEESQGELAVGEREDIEPLIGKVLDAIAAEAGKEREFLSLEVEQVVTGALFAALRKGRERQRTRRNSSVIDKADDEA
jgi:hypothetical protein